MKKLYEIFNKKNEEYNLDDNYILEVRDLVKRYGNFVAVNNISFKVKKGSLFAFLGLNGAGKSTTINIITSIIIKNSGKVFINGRDLDRESYKIKSEIGIVFQNSVLDGALSAKENLQIRSRYYGIKKNEWKEREKILIDMLDLSSFYEKPIAKLSGGQKRRDEIARAMVHNPKLLILDEPTTGLDPQTRVSVWNLINMLREKTGMTVFLTTHYMEEAEKATYIVVMNKGSIIAEGTPNELKNTYSSDYLILHSRREKKTDDILIQDYSYIYNNDLHFYKIKMKDTLSALNFLKMHPEYSDFEIIKGNMDNVFLNITEER